MCDVIYINEASIKKYKCPYCEKRLERSSLITHVDKDHEELIPDDYTSTRIVFNTVNKKEIGNCVICGKETPWNENIARYERYCIDNNNKCKDEASRIAKANMKKVYGKEHLLGDMNHQQKMLSNRSISGTYKFSSGGSTSYTGSYEKKLLEFLDSWGYRVNDIITPGPIIEYEFNGHAHQWITDVLLIPYNLVFDVKDGGSNPNNREMPEYRAKQVAKEKAIRDQNKYNYIRLTDNNFSQLINILGELKYQLLDIDNSTKNDKIIRIHEGLVGIDLNNKPNTIQATKDDHINSMISTAINNTDSTYIIPYMMKNSFDIGYALSNDDQLSSILHMDINGELNVSSSKFLDNCVCNSMFKFIGNRKQLEETNNIVELVTGKEVLDFDQFKYDEDFEEVLLPKDFDMIVEQIITSTIMGSKHCIPIINENYLDNIYLSYYKDDNGYFVKNDNTDIRSESYNSIKEIPKQVIDYISNSSNGIII